MDQIVVAVSALVVVLSICGYVVYKRYKRLQTLAPLLGVVQPKEEHKEN